MCDDTMISVVMWGSFLVAGAGEGVLQVADDWVGGEVLVLEVTLPFW